MKLESGNRTCLTNDEGCITVDAKPTQVPLCWRCPTSLVMTRMNPCPSMNSYRCLLRYSYVTVDGGRQLNSSTPDRTDCLLQHNATQRNASRPRPPIRFAVMQDRFAMWMLMQGPKDNNKTTTAAATTFAVTSTMQHRRVGRTVIQCKQKL